MENQYIRANSIHITHKDGHQAREPIKIISESPLDLMNTVVHCKEYVINNLFKIVESESNLLIKKKVNGVYVDYFKIS